MLSGVAYNARGQELAAALGNGLDEGIGYTDRGWRNGASAGAAYGFHNVTYAPDGDMLGYSETGIGSMVFSYNGSNQLVQACDPQCGGAIAGYTYDRYGNRWSESANFSPSPAPVAAGFTGNNNRMDGYSYDAAGNLTNDGAHTYAYDAESRLIAVDGGATAAYVYNPEGPRSYENVGGVAKEFAYSADGRMLVLGGNQSEIADEMYAAGRHIATRTASGMIWAHASYLGTTRLETNVSGQAVNVFSEWPFGEWLNQVGAYSNLHFTGKYDDTESGLDYFGARYYSSQLGRFLTPDWSEDPDPIPYADLSDPQSLNLYAYTENNPVTATDPDGHLCCQWLESAYQALVGAGSTPTGGQGNCGNPCVVTTTPPEIFNPFFWAFSGFVNTFLNNQSRSTVPTISNAAMFLVPGGDEVEVGEGVVDVAEEAAEAGGAEIQFGNNANQLAHAFRHVEAAGLDSASVESAVRADLKTSASRIVTGQPLNQTIQVDGRSITYTAFRLPNGVINVGRITVE